MIQQRIAQMREPLQDMPPSPSSSHREQQLLQRQPQRRQSAPVPEPTTPDADDRVVALPRPQLAISTPITTGVSRLGGRPGDSEPLDPAVAFANVLDRHQEVVDEGTVETIELTDLNPAPRPAEPTLGTLPDLVLCRITEFLPLRFVVALMNAIQTRDMTTTNPILNIVRAYGRTLMTRDIARRSEYTTDPEAILRALSRMPITSPIRAALTPRLSSVDLSTLPRQTFNLRANERPPNILAAPIEFRTAMMTLRMQIPGPDREAARQRYESPPQNLTTLLVRAMIRAPTPDAALKLLTLAHEARLLTSSATFATDALHALGRHSHDPKNAGIAIAVWKRLLELEPSTTTTAILHTLNVAAELRHADAAIEIARAVLAHQRRGWVFSSSTAQSSSSSVNEEALDGIIRHGRLVGGVDLGLASYRGFALRLTPAHTANLMRGGGGGGGGGMDRFVG